MNALPSLTTEILPLHQPPVTCKRHPAPCQSAVLQQLQTTLSTASQYLTKCLGITTPGLTRYDGVYVVTPVVIDRQWKIVEVEEELWFYDPHMDQSLHIERPHDWVVGRKTHVRATRWLDTVTLTPIDICE